MSCELPKRTGTLRTGGMLGAGCAIPACWLHRRVRQRSASRESWCSAMEPRSTSTEQDDAGTSEQQQLPKRLKVAAAQIGRHTGPETRAKARPLKSFSGTAGRHVQSMWYPQPTLLNVKYIVFLTLFSINFFFYCDAWLYIVPSQFCFPAGGYTKEAASRTSQ